MLFDRALPVRFHAFFAGEEAIIEVFPLRLVSGSLPRPVVELVLRWAATHRRELIHDWMLCRLARRPLPIPATAD